MKVEISFNSSVLDPEMAIYSNATVINVERDGNTVTLKPNSEVMRELDRKLEEVGIDNRDIRQAIIIYKAASIISNLSADLLGAVVDRYVYHTIKKNEDAVNPVAYIERLQEYLDKVNQL